MGARHPKLRRRLYTRHICGAMRNYSLNPCKNQQKTGPRVFNWDDLRYVLELSRRGRLAAAARALQVDHTTVARRVAALENTLNTRLFDRTPRGYVLTKAGTALLAHAER